MGKIDWKDRDAVRVYNRDWYAKNREKYKGYRLKWAKENPESHKAAERKWRKRNPKSQLLASAKHRAKTRGLEFNITAADIFIPEFCPVLGIRLTSGCRGFTDSAASLDRVNSNLGYVKGNVLVISWRANKVKNNGTAEEHEKIAKFMRERGE